MQLYRLFDRKAQTYSSPQPSVNHATMVRELEQVFAQPDHPVCKNPEDYELWHCGEAPEEVAELVPAKPAVMICVVSELAVPDTH